MKGCPECSAPSRGDQKPQLQPEERTGVPWERVGIDYTDMSPSDEGVSKILVMIDHATKFVIARPTTERRQQLKFYLMNLFASMSYGAIEENRCSSAYAT